MDHTMKPLEYNSVHSENYVAAVDLNGDTSASHSAKVSQQQEASVPHAPNELLLQQKTKDSDHERNEEHIDLNLSLSSGLQNLEGRHQILELGAMQHSRRDSHLSKMHRQSASFSKQGSRTKQIPFDSDHERNEEQIDLNLSLSSGLQNLEGRHQNLELGAMQHSRRDSQLSKMHCQSASISKQGSRTKHIPFGSLIRFMLSKIGKDKTMKLQSSYVKWQRSEIQKKEFISIMRQLVGDNLLKVAVKKMLPELVASESHSVPDQPQLQSQEPIQKYHLGAPVTSASCQFAQPQERRQDLEMQEPEALEDLRVESRLLCNMYPDSTSDSKMEDSSIESQLLWNIYTHSDSEKGSPTKRIAFGSLLPFILPELDEDKATQVQTFYAKLRKNEDGFIRLMRKVVKKDVLEAAVVKMQAEKAS